jgi:hypothetical protein
MKEYIFYTAEGRTYPPLEGMDVENCQVLGLAFGNSIEEAKVSLLADNPWIIKCGFDPGKIIHRQLVADDIG